MIFLFGVHCHSQQLTIFRQANACFFRRRIDIQDQGMKLFCHIFFNHILILLSASAIAGAGAYFSSVLLNLLRRS